MHVEAMTPGPSDPLVTNSAAPIRTILAVESSHRSDDPHSRTKTSGTPSAPIESVKQLNFSILNKQATTFGGALLKTGTHPKSARPLDAKSAVHLVLRAERSTMRTPQNYKRVNDIVESVARKHKVRIYEYANCGNHLHHVLKLPHRRVWNAFIRALTSQIAKLTGVRWIHRPFTRVIKGWKSAFELVKEYVRLNQIEVDLRLSRTATKDILNRTRPLECAAPP